MPKSYQILYESYISYHSQLYELVVVVALLTLRLNNI